MAGGGLSLVKELRHPILKSILAKDVVQFKAKYAAYEHQIDELNVHRTPSTQLKPTELQHCIDPPLLKSLLRLGVFNAHVEQVAGESNTIDNITELNHDVVKVWLEDRSMVDEADIAARVSMALSEVKHKPNRADALGAVTTFFADILTKLEEHGCDIVVDTAGKELARQVLPLIQPKSVREVLDTEWKFWAPKDKNDFMKFQKYVTASVVEAAKWTNKRGFEAEETGDPEGSSNKKRRGAGGSQKQQGKQGNGEAGKGSGGSNDKGKDAKSSQWKKKCLNPNCDKVHRVRDCEDTPKQLADELLEKLKNKKKGGSAKAVVLKASDGSFKYTQADGRWKAVLGDNTEVIARGDVGADFSCIPRSLLKNLTQDNKQPEEKKLDQALFLEGATEKVKMRATGMVRADVTLQLNCAPLRLRNTEWLILDDDMSEILLGRPLLKALGFDVDEHLEANHAVLNDQEFDTGLLDQINSTPKPSGKAVRFSCYTGLTSENADPDPIEPMPTAGAAMGEDTEDEIQQAFEKMLKNAEENGMSEKGLATAKELLYEFRDIFRIRLGKDAPAKIPPMEVKLKPGAKPVKSNQRRYAPAQREFLSTTIKKLESLGAVRANPTSRWASPALAVPKPGAEGFRFTVDLRRANQQIEPMASSMPHLESLFQSVSGSRFFSKIDLCHAYWQIALALACQEFFSIQTPIGIFTPDRLIQGSTDAGNYFQGTTEPLFSQHADLMDKFLQWLDDFLLHAKTEEELLRALRAFFDICREFGLKVHALKTELFAKEATFCGRVFDQNGMRFHPSKFEALKSMQRPELAADLLQFTFALNWMRTSIPNYSKLVAPLLELLEECYKEVGGRTKKKLGKLSLTSKWGTVHQDSFDLLRSTLEDQIKLAFPKPDHDIVLCTDASETHWSGVLTQVPKMERKLPVEEQKHEPLGFVSGSFKNASFSWATVEKEAFAVLESFIRFEHLIGGREISLYTDHANLVYIFDPCGQNPGIARHTACKLTRWAVKLSSFRYVIEAIPGERNHWADLLTRWAVQPRSAVSRVAKLVMAPIAPQLSEDPEWPDLGSLRSAQQNATEEMPPECMVDHMGLARFESKALWVPDSDKSMQLRLLVAAHTGPGGHRGASTTVRGMRDFVMWTSMEDDAKAFVGSCLHCLSTTTGGKVPRPMAQTLHATAPNKLLHMDFLYIYPGVDGYNYVLVLKDDFSSYVSLVKCKAADAEHTAKALVDWFATFGVVLNWVSDRGSHFKNEVVERLREQNRASHRFTLAYAPWSNGTVEVVNREVLRVLRALCSELRIAFKEWPNILPVVQGVLNSAVLPRLGDRSPLTVMTGLPADTPLASITTSQDEQPRAVDVSGLKALQRRAIDGALSALGAMHKEVKEKQTAARQSKIDAHNKRTHVRPCNFGVGDYVLRGVRAGQHRSKLALRWTGPYRVVKVLSDFVFVLEHLLSGEKAEVHGTRIILFRNSSFEVTEEVLGHLKHQEGELHNIAEFAGFRTHQGIPQVKVRWQGFEADEDSWEDIKLIKEDVPVLFGKHVKECRKSGSAKHKEFLRAHRL